MLTILALLIILLGLYLIISGLREAGEWQDGWYEWDEGVEVGRWEEEERWMEEEREEQQEWRREKRGEWEEREKVRKVDVKGGGVILIGPIPIVFGNSKYAAISLILAIVLMILSIFLMTMH